MINFKKLVIENFQSHVHTECDFHPGLNVFVGPSDSGKSAILRALRWVLFNVPRGTDFIRAGANQSKVELHLSDGTIITRIRNHSSINRYQLEKPNEEALIFEGFGSEVPLEIAEAHQIRPLQLEQKDLLLQMGNQLDGPFLLSESSGTKAKTIGLVSGAHLIDKALKKLNSDRNQLSLKNKFLQQQKQSIAKKLLPYENLENLEKSLRSAEEKAIQVKENQSLLIQLQQLLHKLQVNLQAQQEQKVILAKYPNLENAEHKRIELENKLLHLRQYRLLFHRYHSIQQEKKEQQVVYERTTSLSLVETKVLEQENNLNHSKQYQQLHNSYQVVRKEKIMNNRIYQHTEKINGLTEKLKEIVDKKQQVAALMIQQKALEQMKLDKKKLEIILESNSQLPLIMDEYLPQAESKKSRLLRLQELRQELVDKQDRIANGHKCMMDVGKNLQLLLSEYGDLLSEQGACPVCGSEINDTLIQHLLFELEGGNNYAAAGRED